MLLRRGDKGEDIEDLSDKFGWICKELSNV